MARPYKNELAELGATFEAICSLDCARLVNAIKEGRNAPVRAIGSGGSLSAAHAIAQLHRIWTGQAAMVSTPFEAVAEPLNPEVTSWLISAGGRNSDIIAAAQSILNREPRRVTVLTARSSSPLTELFNDLGWPNIFAVKPPGGKDGFLAVNSLFAFVCVAARAYSVAIDEGRQWSEIERLVSRLVNDESHIHSIKNEMQPLWDRETTVVLHGMGSSVGAIDLESKFTEAALGNLHISDYRNFAHGRHHWLAKRGDKTGIIAFVSDNDKHIANRTLNILPKDVPTVRFNLKGDVTACLVQALYYALVITGDAGAARGIDPGQPGVPDFGRKLYSLKPSRKRPTLPDANASAQEILAISRKAMESTEDMAAERNFEIWLDRLSEFKRNLFSSTFSGIVLDYDGTVVNTNARLTPPSARMGALLTHIAQYAFLGIATGRGQSARRDLQTVLPRNLWKKVLVGYYNASVIASLVDDDSPAPSNEAGPALIKYAELFKKDLKLAAWCEQEDRRTQLTLSPKGGASSFEIWRRVCELTAHTDGHCVKIVRSGHSIDIVERATSKRDIVEALEDLAGSGPLLVIGDRGRWPGNDHELLSTPYSLSVDEISGAPQSCWALAPAGVRGASALEFYLKALEPANKGLRFKKGAFD